ncbi:Zn-dependent protease with chaperone function [Paucimonas lemoignei]|uniref:Zn-dependent protease with chaperone function n=1 Tax=Paucimonas lemoignei TaxID=29443 RepID=A0A4R3HSV3_PAULE|nr:M48 family metallopeptidase [Paucimonas lemoignei]TCS36217.1 Zn-dependent protease with chaperone function [Paucimonas lemoignei]
MIDAIYFDGQSSRRQPVTLIMHKRVVAMRGEGIKQSHRLSRLRLSERLEHVPRILYMPDGGSVHVSDPRLDKMLAANGYRESRVVGWQRNWMLSLLALVAVVALLLSGYQWGLPWVADQVALHMPAALEKKIGDGQLKLLDKSVMAPSELDPVVQARLQRLFADLKQPRGEKTDYRLEFRRSHIGPNAFAVPNGVIVMTDELVKLAENDQAVLGVLGHELGHLQRRHSLRRLMQALGVSVLLNVWVGDASSVVATVPTVLLDQKYSRDFEREADQYAIDMMQTNGIPLEPMAVLFERMEKYASRNGEASHRHEQDAKGEGRRSKSRKDEEEEEPEPLDYFSSHPSGGERVAKLRAADRAKK